MPHAIAMASRNDPAAAATDIIPFGDDATEIPGRLEREHTTAEIEAEVTRWFASI